MANYIITKSPEFFKKIGDYSFTPLSTLNSLPKTIAFDSETTGLDSNLEDMFCCQIGTGQDNYIIHMYDDNYTFNDVIPFLEGKALVLQNATFDLAFMYKYDFYPEDIYDTMIATRILYNGLSYQQSKADFASIMERELGIIYDKTDQKNIHIVKLSQPSAIKYSFNDVDKLLEAHKVLYKKIVDGGFINTYNLHRRFVRALAYMERCGLPINSKMWAKKIETDKIHLKKYSKIVEEYIYDNVPRFACTQLDLFKDFEKTASIKLSSPKQMLDVFNHLEIPTKDHKGKDSIKESIITKSDHEFVSIWLKYQEYNHRVTTFGENVYNKIRNERIYTVFNPMVDTARLSSRAGNINFLNFPSDEATRECFKASPGHKMIVCDWGGQETVIAADLSEDEAMTKSVLDGDDLHSMLARILFPELTDLSDEVIMEKHADLRKASKAPRFAMQYGGNAHTLHSNDGIPMKRAIEIEKGFKDLHKGLYEWGNNVFEEALKKGYICSADGWKLHLPFFEDFKDREKIINAMSTNDWRKYRIGKEEREREKTIKEHNATLEKGGKKIEFLLLREKEYNYYKKKVKDVRKYFIRRNDYFKLSLNNPVQTTGSHQMKLALCLIFEWILENNYINIIKLCNAIHDETVCEAPEDLAELTKDKVTHFMKEAGNKYLTKLKIKADAHVGESWYEAK